VDKALKRSGGLDTLSGETRNYIAGLAQGGDVKSYAGNGPDGSDVQDDSLKDNEYLNRSRGVVEGVKSLGSNISDALTTPKNYDLYDMYQRNIGRPFAAGVDRFVNEPLESQEEKFRSYSMTPNKTPTVGFDVPAGSNTPVPTAPATPSPYGSSEDARLHARYPSPVTRSSTPSQQDWQNFDQASALFEAENANKTPTPGADETLYRPDTVLDELKHSIKDQATQLAKQGKINAALSLMQTGFGMMASKSPYALGGIGEGAQSGIGTYAALSKQQQEGMKDLLASRLGLYKYGEASKNSAREYALKEKAYADRNKMSDAELQYKIAEGARKEREYNQTHLLNVDKILSADIDKNNYDMTPEQKRAAVYAHPMYRDAAIKAGIDMSQLMGGAPAVGTVKGGYKFKGGNPNDQNNWEKV
jgi:hypothetical protein